jgi:hypothetical protein
MPEELKKEIETHLVGQTMVEWDDWVEKYTYAN